MLTVEQKEMINNWVSDCSQNFEDAFTDMALLSNLFGLSGNTCQLSSDTRDYINELVGDGVLRSSGGWCGTVYWRA